MISLETEQAIPNGFRLLQRANDACVFHHSAFEFYGYGNQVFIMCILPLGKGCVCFIMAE